MNSYGLGYSKWPQFHQFILQSEKEGLVTRTFRRLDLHRQEAIVNAILDEAAERGPMALNIKLVAQRAGVSVGSLYQYFKDRESMLDFAVELCVRYTIDLFDGYRTFLVSMPLREALSAYLIGGVVVIEQVFNLPGLGRQLVQGIQARDLPTVQALLLFFVVVAIVVNLAVDLLYARLDPRVRYE